jgi:membrane protease subunit HflC
MQDRTMPVLFVLAFALLAIGNTAFIVDQREKAVLFQLGELKRADYTPGLHFKLPFMQTVRKFDGRIQELDNPTENFLTAEKKNVEVDSYVKWIIADPTAYYRATGGQPIVAADRLSGIINAGLRSQFGTRTIQQAINTDRVAMMQALETEAKAKVKELGIELIDVRIKSINLPREVSDSVYDRMRAERTQEAANLRARGEEEKEKIKANADRDAQVKLADAYREAEKLRGEGDAKAAEIYAKAYGADAEFYRFYRSMQAYRDSIGGPNDVLVIEPDGEFFKGFKGN